MPDIRPDADSRAQEVFPAVGGDESARLADWLLFAALEIRPRLARRLLEVLGSPGAVLDASRGELEECEGVTPDLAERAQSGRDRRELATWMEFARRQSVEVVPFDSPAFPWLLNQIPDPPAALFVRGSVDALSGDAVAIVGTRHPTREGVALARTIAAGLAAAGVTVVSGGALGIDTAAHSGAVGAGRSVAVLGCGLDASYPMSNQNLFEKIAGQGAVVSEYAMGARPDSWRFPARNRIISGLCRAVVVVEAARKSGALITAGFAAEQGREVMAAPGLVSSAQSKGCHALIRDGATLVEDAEQILESLGLVARPTPPGTPLPGATPPDLPIDQGALLLALSSGQRHLDELSSECGLAPAQAGAAITLLEMRGLVRRFPGNHFARV